MKCIKGILWAVLLVTFGIGFTEEWLWGPNPRFRFAIAYHIRNVPLFVVRWIAVSVAMVFIYLHAKAA